MLTVNFFFFQNQLGNARMSVAVFEQNLESMDTDKIFDPVNELLSQCEAIINKFQDYLTD